MDSLGIGRKLRELRGERSINEVADALGLGRSALANYELGLRIPRDDVKVVLADYYGLSVGELFYAENLTKREEAVQQ